MKNSIDFHNEFAEQLINSIKTANEGITHADFVAGIKKGSMGFKVMFGEPNKLLYGSRKTMFNLFVMLYMVVPFIIIPVFAYHADNWWLLFGMFFSYLFSFFATWGTNKSSGKWMSNLIYYFLIFCMVYWIRRGFHIYDYATFFFFCSLWGTFFFKVADQAQFDYALQLLTENAQLFNLAVEKNQIMIIHKEVEDKKENEDLNQDKSSKLLEIADVKFKKGNYNAAINDYTKSIECYPFVSAFEKRGKAKQNLRDFKGAINDYSSAIDRMPSIPNKRKFADIYYSRAVSNRATGLINEALSDFIESDKLKGEENIRTKQFDAKSCVVLDLNENLISISVDSKEWKDFSIGHTKEYMEKFLSDPGIISSKYDDVYFVDYKKYGLLVNYNLFSNVSQALFFYNQDVGDSYIQKNIGYPIRVKKSISWDSSLKEVEKVFGVSMEQYEFNDGSSESKRIVYAGIDFRFIEGKLVRIGIN